TVSSKAIATPTLTATTPSSTTTATAAVTATSTTTAALPADCPAPGTARPAKMPPDATAVPPAVFYLTELGGVQSGIWAKDLKRYDLTTGQTTTILSFPQSLSTSTDDRVTAQISLSPDKHWLLIATNSALNSTGIARLQIIRTDGTQVQTLTCATSTDWGTPLWSPDQRHIAFSTLGGNEAIATDILDLTTGRMEQIPAVDYIPQAWLDATRLYVERLNGIPELSLLDISKGQNQQPGNFIHIASINTPCGAFEPAANATQLYTTSCTQVTLNNCQGGNGLQGPSTISVQPATGGKATTVYNSPSHAIFTLHVVNQQTILFYIDNSAGDLSQNGLWKINTNGSGLTRLTTEPGLRCFDPYPQYGPQIASNSQSYAQLTSDFTSGPSQAIQVGSISGGTPTTIATPDPAASPGMLLVLIGMA
ncbi:MAG TPA: hypothetical protein VKR06_04125, partial [Ktedonosporobacter sp.]|nr:hypothetical protein [Ktedonosporobacter sp.]